MGHPPLRSFRLQEVAHRADEVRIVAKLSRADVGADSGDLNALQDRIDCFLDGRNEVLAGTDAAADDEAFRVVRVLDVVDGACQRLYHLLDSLCRLRITLSGQYKDLAPIEAVVWKTFQSLAETRDILCRASGAEYCGTIVADHVAEFTAVEMRAVVNAAILDDGAADATADDEKRDILAVLGDANPSLAERRAVRIVLHRDGQSEHICHR